MSAVRFIGCLHFGHTWMAKHRGFSTSAEHDQHLIDSWNKVVNKRDVIYILGDISMEDPLYYHYLNELRGTKRVILGNHDLARDIPELLKYVDNVQGMLQYKGFWITHCPIHPQELNFVRGNIHAHVHEVKIPEIKIEVNYWDKKDSYISGDGKGYYNVDAYRINYTPVTIEEIYTEGWKNSK